MDIKGLQNEIARSLMGIAVIPTVLGLVISMLTTGWPFGKTPDVLNQFYISVFFFSFFFNIASIPKNFKMALDMETIDRQIVFSFIHFSVNVIICLIIPGFLPESKYVLYGAIFLGLVLFIFSLFGYFMQRGKINKAGSANRKGWF